MAIYKEDFYFSFLKTLFISKNVGVNTYLLSTKNYINTEYVSAILRKNTAWAYHYIIPADQTLNTNNLILVGFWHFKLPVNYTPTYENFKIIGEDGLILDYLMGNIDFEKINLLSHSCVWSNQLFFAELLDCMWDFNNPSYPPH
jgi:hypothetical protein